MHKVMTIYALVVTSALLWVHCDLNEERRKWKTYKASVLCKDVGDCKLMYSIDDGKNIIMSGGYYFSKDWCSKNTSMQGKIRTDNGTMIDESKYQEEK